jgi:hypothetical protein
MPVSNDDIIQPEDSKLSASANDFIDRDEHEQVQHNSLLHDSTSFNGEQNDIVQDPLPNQMI